MLIYIKVSFDFLRLLDNVDFENCSTNETLAVRALSDIKRSASAEKASTLVRVLNST